MVESTSLLDIVLVCCMALGVLLAVASVIISFIRLRRAVNKNAKDISETTDALERMADHMEKTD